MYVHGHKERTYLLPSGCRAWDFSKPLLLAPAMNTFMWDSPFTAQHLAACEQLGATVSACKHASLPACLLHLQPACLSLPASACALGDKRVPSWLVCAGCAAREQAAGLWRCGQRGDGRARRHCGGLPAEVCGRAGWGLSAALCHLFLTTCEYKRWAYHPPLPSPFPFPSMN